MYSLCRDMSWIAKGFCVWNGVALVCLVSSCLFVFFLFCSTLLCSVLQVSFSFSFLHIFPLLYCFFSPPHATPCVVRFPFSYVICIVAAFHVLMVQSLYLQHVSSQWWKLLARMISVISIASVISTKLVPRAYPRPPYESRAILHSGDISPALRRRSGGEKEKMCCACAATQGMKPAESEIFRWG